MRHAARASARCRSSPGSWPAARTCPRRRSGAAELRHEVERMRVNRDLRAGPGAFGVADAAIVQRAVYDAVDAMDRRARRTCARRTRRRWYWKRTRRVAAGPLWGSSLSAPTRS